MIEQRYRLLPEWTSQKAVLLSWPHAGTDWQPMLGYIEPCYVEYVKSLTQVGPVIIVCPDHNEVEKHLYRLELAHPCHIMEMPTNDTWTRDSGPIMVTDGNAWRLLDFKFNGWGLKFAACYDNLISRNLISAGVFPENMQYVNCQGFVLEGGSIDIDEDGTLLTTRHCLLSPNRNGEMTECEIEQKLIEELGATKVVWLDHGSLIGDDTDSHVDTLARFLPGGKIAYTACNQPADPQYDELKRMEDELRTVTNASGQRYQLIPLYIPRVMYDFHSERIPATYVNFLLFNGTVFLPVYGSRQYDDMAIQALKEAMPDWNIVPVPSLYLGHQHGSFHCATMQLPCTVI